MVRRRFTTFFEDWLLGDGCYQPLEVGQVVNLAFRLMPMRVRPATVGASAFESLGNGSCNIVGTVTRRYPQETSPIAVIEAGDFRCYVESDDFNVWPVGTVVDIFGTIWVDYYIWSERISVKHPDAPDLFYPLRVERIRFGRLREQFVHRDANGQMSITMEDATNHSNYDMTDVQSMWDDDRPPSDSERDALVPVSWLLDVWDENLPDEAIPHTFQ